MSDYKLLMSIVPHDKGEKLTRAAMESGCQGGTVLIGRGLAKSNLCAVLGVGETTKDVILMVVSNAVKNSVKNAIIQAASSEKANFGELICTDVSALFKSGSAPKNGQEDIIEDESQTHQTEKDETMAENANNKDVMITVIVNKGYADDIMAAARAAGAEGGTVVLARGTARENDERIFGVHIVPEKEMLLIVVPAEKLQSVSAAIKSVKCLKEPGMGIVYNSAVEDFSKLGKAKK